MGLRAFAPRYSLKAMLLVTLAAAAFVNSCVRRARERKEATEYFLSRGMVKYFWSSPEVTVRFAPDRRSDSRWWPSRVPMWLSKLVGDRHLNDIERLSLYAATEEDLRRLRAIDYIPELVVFDDRDSCADMEWLFSLEELEYLSYHRYIRLGEEPPSGDRWVMRLKYLLRLRHLSMGRGTVTDEGMRHIASLVELEYLDLSMNPISTVGLRRLDALRNLEDLDLLGTDIDNGAIECLARHRSLKRLSICDCRYLTDDGGLEWLKKQLPSCWVMRSLDEERESRARLKAEVSPKWARADKRENSLPVVK